VVTALVGLLPLAFRLLWARKIRQLGIHQLEVAESGIVIHGTDLRLQSLLASYQGVIETRRYFILTRPNGLFSFIPKRRMSSDVANRIRGILQAGISREQTRALAPGEVAS